MKLPPFAYEAPETLAEVLDLLAEWGDEAKVLAGGQSLIPLLAFRLARPGLLVDINRVRELESAEHASGRLVFGSLTRHRAVEQASPGRIPTAIREAVAQIGHPAIRNRGTVGGSLAHADPSSEWGATALVYDGIIPARSASGERRIPAEKFFVGFLASDLRPDEVITRLELRLPEQPTGSAFVEYARRHGDFALAGVAVVLALSAERAVGHVRVAVMGATSQPTRCHAAEGALLGREFGDVPVDDAAQALSDDLELTGTDSDDRRFGLQIARTLARRALRAAAGRAEREVDARAG
jgi:aerobic carbon-monoxide dehydrogenase medium subunit